MPSKLKVLAGCVVRQEPQVFQTYLKLLTLQIIPEAVQMDLAFILDCKDDDVLNKKLEKLARGVKAKLLPPRSRPEGAIYAVGDRTHIWAPETFAHLAGEKHRLCSYAMENGYDYMWLVDSDLLLEPTTLRSLLCTYRSAVSAVFWTEWQADQPASLGPNVWLKHPYGQEGYGMLRGEFWQDLADRKLLEVAGGGACFLMHRAVHDKGVHYSPLLAALPQEDMWRGEDRTFALRAERFHVKQFADAWPDIFHAYHPTDRTPEALEEIYDFFQAPRQTYAKYGDLVSFTLENLEEPATRDIMLTYRGRLGGMKLLPEIEHALLQARVEEERLFEVAFPSWFPPIQPRPDKASLAYAGQKKTLRLRLVDAKPYGFAPTLAQHAFGGLK